MQRTLTLVVGDVRLNSIMRDADIFEEFKKLVEIVHAKCTPKEGKTWADVVADIRAVTQKDGTYEVYAAFLPNDPEGAWVNDAVTAYSDGKGWDRADTILSKLGYIKPVVPV